MSKEILLVVDAVANEKGVAKNVIFDAMEAALASAAKKRYPDDVSMRVSIDRQTGEYETFRRWEVVADDVVMESPDRQLRLMDAVDEVEGIEVGGYVEQSIENPAPVHRRREVCSPGSRGSRSGGAGWRWPCG